MALALCEVRLAGKGQRVGQADLLKLVDLEFMRPRGRFQAPALLP